MWAARFNRNQRRLMRPGGAGHRFLWPARAFGHANELSATRRSIVRILIRSELQKRESSRYLSAMRLSFTLSLIVGLCLFGGLNVQGSDTPPSPYIDQGACPFEGCIYREWTAKKEKILLDRPGGSRVVVRIRPGERVLGITGEVRSTPLRVVAQLDHPDPERPDKILIRKGQIYYVLHCRRGRVAGLVSRKIEHGR